MANELRVKRRLPGGAAGAPASLKTGELAWNQQDDVIYGGRGDAGGGTASEVVPVGGRGHFAPKVEGVHALSGTAAALSAANGTIQTHTLTGNTTYTDGLAAGESLTLMIDDGTAYSITWPTITWVNNAGGAPTLATTGYTVIAVWKVGSTLYGALVGDGT